MVKKLMFLAIFIAIAYIAVAVPAPASPSCPITANVLHIEKARTNIEGKGNPPMSDFDYFAVKLDIQNISSGLRSGPCNKNSDCLTNVCTRNNCYELGGIASCDYAYLLSLNKSKQMLSLSEYDRNPIFSGQKINARINCWGDESFSGCFLSDIEIIPPYDLSDFPAFIEKSIVDTSVVIGDSANIFDLQSGIFIIRSYDDCAYLNFGNKTIPKSTSKNLSINLPRFSICRSAATTLANDILDLSAQNLISVGGPCANNITAQIMGLSGTWPECDTGFEEGKGIIKLYNKWNKTQVVVAGYNAEDTRRAAMILANSKSNLSGHETKTSTIANVTIISEIRCDNLSDRLENDLLTREWFKKDDPCAMCQACRVCSCTIEDYLVSGSYSFNRKLISCVGESYTLNAPEGKFLCTKLILR